MPLPMTALSILLVNSSLFVITSESRLYTWTPLEVELSRALLPRNYFSNISLDAQIIRFINFIDDSEERAVALTAEGGAPLCMAP